MFVVVGANRIRPVFVFAIFILGSADARFRFQDSSFKIQVSSKLLPNISPCLEGSTEHSDGSLGGSLRKIALVACDGVSGKQREQPRTKSRDNSVRI